MRLEFEPNAATLPHVNTDAANQSVSSELDKLLRDGVKAAQEGKRAEARTLLLRVTEVDADNENAWLWLASISEYPEELLVFLNNVLRVNPTNERALEWHRATRSLLSKTLVQRGVDAIRDERHDFAKQCFEQAIDHEADSELAWLWLASIADEAEEKARCFNKVLEINPENETARTSLDEMSSAKTKGVFDEALKAAMNGDHLFACEALATLLARDEAFVDAWLLKAHIAPTFEERAESYLKIRELDPENDFARVHLASWRALTELHPREVAEAVAEEAPAEVEEIVEEAAAPQTEAFVDEQPEAAVELEAEEQVTVAVEEAPLAEEHFAEDFSSDFSAYPKTVELSDFRPAVDEVEEVAAVAETVEEPALETAPAVEEAPSYEDFNETDAEFGDEQLLEDIPMADSSEDSAALHLSFLQADDDDEAEAFFRNLTEISDASQTATPAEAETPAVEDVQMEAAEPTFADADAETQDLATIDDYRNTSPTIFANYDAQSVENSFVGRVEPIADEPTGDLPDIFQPAEEVFAEASVEAPAIVEESPAPVEESVATFEEQSHEEFPPARPEVALCPFCLTENEPNAFSCASCQTVLTLSDIEMLLAPREINEDVLKKAVASLEAENESYGLAADQILNLGLGHINLKNYRQGYHFLQEAARLNPNNVIPDAQVNALAIRLSEIEEQQAGTVANVKTCKILVVDDSPTVRKLISGKLEKCGHDVICAVDGLDALSKINDMVPDLILLDITMPRMDGYQVCKMIRGNEATKDVPVVMISGKDGFFDKVRGKMAGTTGYITKPFGPETLMKTVETYLG